jgi:hypothetical protein
VRVTVTDRGSGIPPEFHSRIFEKFVQVESRIPKPTHSTGLGLAFCKLAVEAHGGQIGVESQVGRGSTFWIDLPTSMPADVPGDGLSPEPTAIDAHAIMMTGLDDARNILGSFKSRCDAYCVKPVNKEQLLGDIKGFGLVQ